MRTNPLSIAQSLHDCLLRYVLLRVFRQDIVRWRINRARSGAFQEFHSAFFVLSLSSLEFDVLFFLPRPERGGHADVFISRK